MERINEIVARTLKSKLLSRRKDIRPEFNFADDLELSDLEFSMLLFYLESALKVQIGDREVEIDSTVKDLVECLTVKCNAFAPVC